MWAGTKIQTARLIVALSVLLSVAAKAPPETTPELPTIWEQKTLRTQRLLGENWSCLPAVGEDRSVYVGSSDGVLYAFSGSGSRGWKYDTNRFATKRSISEDGVAGIAIDSSGTIYATSDGLLALDKDGVLKWRVWAGKNGHASAPALGANDRIHVLLGENLYTFASDGTVEWVSEIGAPAWARSAPVVARDGTVYVAGSKRDTEKFIRLLYAFRSDGALKWTLVKDFPSDSPALDEEGTVYFLGDRGLNAVDKEGKLKWFYDTQGLSGSSTPAVSSDHVIYFGRDSFLFAVGPDGKLKWRFETDDKVRSSPAIDERGNVWFVSNDEHLYCVDLQGTLVGVWPFQGLRYATPLIGRHGEIYLCDSRSLRVLRGTNGPGDCPWPMQRHDVQGTGNVGF